MTIRDQVIIGLANENDQQQSALNDLRHQQAIQDAEIFNQQTLNRQQQGLLEQANISSGNLAVENARLREELESYKRLLTMPLHEIANANGTFKDTYLKQQLLISKWILAQQFFRDLSLRFADQLGLTKDEVAKALAEIKPESLERAAKEYPEVERWKEELKNC
ncbi:hypothetical protein [Pandoraea pnomenusa]|uniref:hypothetical protein n=1 Tax=Pandoraea pnomenusa TaxID=93220 RepID=UPI001146869F|nr:hypothetical protein [Pandoraea pnomenusa]MBN9092040.1 hypothetical protein [Pandoraea pnomenusa]QDH59459.1 hypothetical protein FKQ53_09305 [Pandoraea pnomenusa]